MKCPDCSFVVSELRDICPKCLFDLRSHKLAQGLKVTSPHASYEELTAKLTKPGKTNDEGIGGFFDAFKKFIGSADSKTTVESTTPRDRDSAPPISTTAVSPPTPSAPPPAIDAKVIEQPEAPLPPSQKKKPRRPEEPSLPAGPPPRSAILNRSVPDNLAISQLFDVAEQDVAVAYRDSEVEFINANLQNLAEREDIKLLFDIALDSFSNPDAERALKSDYSRSEGKMLEATFVSAQLEKVEKIFSESLTMLKNVGRRGKPTRKEDSYRLKGPKPLIDPGLMEYPTIRTRLLCVAIDYFFVAILSLLVGGGLTEFFGLDFPGILHPGSMRDIDLLAMLIASFSAFCFITPLFFVSAHALYGTTPGIKLLGLCVLSETGRDMKAANALARGLLFPLSSLLCGGATLFRTKRTAHDILARTTLCLDRRNQAKILSIKVEEE